jgi:2-keto-4-pentenoate hydratase
MTRAFPVAAVNSIVANISGLGSVTAVLGGKDEK